MTLKRWYVNVWVGVSGCVCDIYCISFSTCSLIYFKYVEIISDLGCQNIP